MLPMVYDHSILKTLKIQLWANQYWTVQPHWQLLHQHWKRLKTTFQLIKIFFRFFGLNPSIHYSVVIYPLRSKLKRLNVSTSDALSIEDACANYSIIIISKNVSKSYHRHLRLTFDKGKWILIEILGFIPSII